MARQMKTSAKVAFCGVISSLALVIMLAAYFPYATFALPALAGLLLALIVLEVNFRWALVSYVVVALLCCFMCEPNAVVLFVGFFGYYPVLKSKLERLKNRVLEWVVKLLILNAAMVICYFAATLLLGVSASDLGDFGKYSLPVLGVLLNAVFAVYDIALTGVITADMHKLHPKLARFK